MKHLILIITLFIALSIQAQTSYNPARKLIYVRTCTVANKKPPISQLPEGTWGYNSTDSTLYKGENGQVIAFARMYTKSAGANKVVLSDVTEATTYNFSARKKMYYVLYDSASGNLPILADFPTSIYQGINLHDSVWYDKYNGVVRAAKVFYYFIPTHPSIITPIFYNGWEDGIVTANSYNHFRYSDQKASDRIAIQSTGARVGSKCVRIEVQAGDSDAGNTTQERTEYYGPRDATNKTIFVTEQSGVVQYEFSVKFDSTWQPIINTPAGKWGIFWQIHPPSEFNNGTPTLALSATNTNSITLYYRCGDVTDNPAKQKFNLSDGTLRIGEWIDFKITIKYSKTSTGYIKIERRDTGESTFTTVLNKLNLPTMSFSPLINGGSPGNEYLKTGLYRNAQTFTSVLYLDNFTISTVK